MDLKENFDNNLFNKIFKFNIGDLVVHKTNKEPCNKYIIIERILSQDCNYNFGKVYTVRSANGFSEGKAFNYLEIELEKN